ncbi:MAG TPA: hypothetical protein VM364_08060 [Vicinamibacterales bacterium]|nr:hypothetical protein [Vicinamibacterales bacterium]
MAFVHGKNTVFKLDNPAGVLTDIKAYCDQASLQRMNDLVETNPFGAAAKQRVKGMADAKISIGGPFDPALDAVLATDPAGDASRTFEFLPAGAGAGLPKRTGECHVSDYNVDSSSDGAVTWSANLEVTGPVDSTVQA